jgi:hypothetical protein
MRRVVSHDARLLYGCMLGVEGEDEEGEDEEELVWKRNRLRCGGGGAAWGGFEKREEGEAGWNGRKVSSLPPFSFLLLPCLIPAAPFHHGSRVQDHGVHRQGSHAAPIAGRQRGFWALVHVRGGSPVDERQAEHVRHQRCCTAVDEWEAEHVGDQVSMWKHGQVGALHIPTHTPHSLLLSFLSSLLLLCSTLPLPRSAVFSFFVRVGRWMPPRT